MFNVYTENIARHFVECTNFPESFLVYFNILIGELIGKPRSSVKSM
jgi:hypothetical protein